MSYGPIACAACALFTAPLLAQSFLPTGTAVGHDPAAAASADFDGDGRADLAVANRGDGTISVVLGTATAELAQGGTFAAGVRPIRPATGDLNGDGFPDVVVIDEVQSDVKVLLGDGAGALAAAAATAVSPEPRQLALGDVDGDADLDAVVFASVGSGGALIALLGDGSGAFAGQVVSPAIVSPAVGIANGLALGDLDGDGMLDAVLSIFSGTGAGNAVLRLLGDGSGGFAAPLSIPLAHYPTGLALGDFDGDGLGDVAVPATFSPFSQSDSQPGVIEVFRGGAGGGFTPAGTVDAGRAPLWIDAGDLDGDGRFDLAVANFLAGTVWTYRSLGFGAFAPPQQALACAFPATTATIADFDGDGRSDVAATHGSNASAEVGYASLFRGAPAGGFDGPRAFFAGSLPGAFAAGDLDGDGDPDVVVADSGAGFVTRLLGDGAGALGAALAVPAGFVIHDVELADANGDGALDLVAVRSTSELQIWDGNGTGSFLAPAVFAVGLSPRAIEVADFDLDGAADFAVAETANLRIRVLGGDGAGGVTGTIGLVTLGGKPVRLAAADFNRDGRPDLASVPEFSSSVNVLLGTGTGALQSPFFFQFDGAVADLVVADLDGDGFEDLIGPMQLSTPAGLGPSLLRGKGNGNFFAKQMLDVGRARAAAVGDANGDGRADLALALERTSVAVGLGGTTFGAPALHPGIGLPEALELVDLDGDCRPELLATGSYADAVLVLENTAAGGLLATVGSGCPGGAGVAPLLALFGTPAAGGTVTLQIKNAPGGAQALLFIGLGISTAALPGGCTLYPAPLLPAVVVLPLGGTGPVGGSVSATGTLPAVPSGTTVAMQALVLDPSAAFGYSATAAVKWVAD